jgi:hypothetical protein
MLVYKSSTEENGNQSWTLQWTKSFNNPILGIYHTDLTGDGMKELIIVTTRSVIVLQHNVDIVKTLLEHRMNTIKQRQQ